MIPNEFIHFIYVTALSFLVGLELKAYRIYLKKYNKPHIGSTRTFTFIGMIGFIFFKINIYFYLVGFFSLSAIYLIYYYKKLSQERYSIISFLLLSLVYSLGASIELFGIWMPTLTFVLIVFVLGLNRSFKYLFEKIDLVEFETLGKFLLLSAVILPILPHNPLPLIEISPFKIWFIVVIVSSISYGSYISQKYIFKNHGYLVAGVLGGLYSSTATTVVLAKKSEFTNISSINASIIIATSMMYIRVWILSFIFNKNIAYGLAIPLFLLASIGVLISLYLYKRTQKTSIQMGDKNPLELRTALLFAFLFIVMIILTKFIYNEFGNIGIKIFSFFVGFTDIDPFILSLLTGKYTISNKMIISSILIAISSNNFLKAFYAFIFGKKLPKISIFILVLLGIMTLLSSFILERIQI